MRTLITRLPGAWRRGFTLLRARMQGARLGSLLTRFRQLGRARLQGDAGMNTAEYAVGTLAAVAFAGILLKVLTSGNVQSALTAVIDRALK